MKFEKLDEIAKIGQIEVNSLNCGKLRKIAFLLAGEVGTAFFTKRRIKSWKKLVQIG